MAQTAEATNLREQLAHLHVRCAHMGCEHVATQHDPRPVKTTAFYYLCDEHYAEAEEQLARTANIRPYMVQFTVYIDRAFLATSPEEALEMARHDHGLSITGNYPGSTEIAEIRLVTTNTTAEVPDSLSQWQPY